MPCCLSPAPAARRYPEEDAAEDAGARGSPVTPSSATRRAVIRTYTPPTSVQDVLPGKLLPAAWAETLGRRVNWYPGVPAGYPALAVSVPSGSRVVFPVCACPEKSSLNKSKMVWRPGTLSEVIPY
jgi:hypothetical protein